MLDVVQLASKVPVFPVERWFEMSPVAEARKQGYLAVDTETSSLNAAAAEMVGVSMALSASSHARSMDG